MSINLNVHASAHDVITGDSWMPALVKRLYKTTYTSRAMLTYRHEAREAFLNTIQEWESADFLTMLCDVFVVPDSSPPVLRDNWRNNFPLIYHLVRGNRTFPTNIHKKVFKQVLYTSFAEDGADLIVLMLANSTHSDDEDDDSVEDVADAALHAYVPPSQDTNAIRLARCADNDDTEMNASTKIMWEWLDGQYEGMSFDSWFDRTATDVYDFTQGCVEDNSDDFDEQYYQVFYADRKSACVNWCLLAKKLNAVMRPLYN